MSFFMCRVYPVTDEHSSCCSQRSAALLFFLQSRVHLGGQVPVARTGSYYQSKKNRKTKKYFKEEIFQYFNHDKWYNAVLLISPHFYKSTFPQSCKQCSAIRACEVVQRFTTLSFFSPLLAKFLSWPIFFSLHSILFYLSPYYFSIFSPVSPSNNIQEKEE